MTPDAEFLNGTELAVGGAIGGFAAFVLTMALPYVAEVAEGRIKTRPGALQILGVILLAGFHMFMGGIAATIVGDAPQYGQAITFGLAWPAVVKGAGEGLKAVAAAKGSGDAADPATE